MAVAGQPPAQISLGDTVVGQSYRVVKDGRTWRGTVTAKTANSIAFRIFPEDVAAATARNVTLPLNAAAEVTELEPGGQPPIGARRRKTRKTRRRKTRRRN